MSGLGAFFDAKVNPSEVLVGRLERHLKELGEGGFGKGVRIASTVVLQAAAESIDRYLDYLYGGFVEEHSVEGEESVEMEDVVPRRRLCLHLGADMHSDSFLLEYQGRNEATFARPDEIGWQPYQQRIVSHRDMSHCLMTALPVEKIKRRLRKSHQHVGVSTDAGGFVCNWMYYRSLDKSYELKSVGVLFVHLPSFQIINEDEQVAFLVDLITQCTALHWD